MASQIERGCCKNAGRDWSGQFNLLSTSFYAMFIDTCRCPDFPVLHNPESWRIGRRSLAKTAMPKNAIDVAPELLDDLVAANRILADQGILDAFGHVSVRHPDNPEHYLMSRWLAPALVTAEDIVEYDLESVALSHPDVHLYSERYIHSEIYKVRPDVHAIVHSHSPTVVPFGVTHATFRPILHNAAFKAGFLNRQLRVALRALRSAHDLAAQLVVARLFADASQGLGHILGFDLSAGARVASRAGGVKALSGAQVDLSISAALWVASFRLARLARCASVGCSRASISAAGHSVTPGSEPQVASVLRSPRRSLRWD